jgi:dTDP-4-dehydrorhamnose reductase
MAAAIPSEIALRILLTGKNGQLGRELETRLASLGSVTALGHAELDLAKPDDIRRVVREVRPELILNAAAYTAVDRAESDEALAYAVNATAPGVMSEEAKRLGALLVHYSTDYVFDGSGTRPYVEDDLPNPQNVYGSTKLAGEQAVQQAGANHLIFRTAWVYAHEGRNFLLTMLRLATQRNELRVVNDQFGSPTWSREIAAATTSILGCVCARSPELASAAEYSGLFHMTAAGETTWYDFASAIFEQMSRQNGRAEGWIGRATDHRPLIASRVVPISTPEYPTPARRPRYSVLSNEKLNKTFGVFLPDWRTQLQSACGADPDMA